MHILNVSQTLLVKVDLCSSNDFNAFYWIFF